MIDLARAFEAVSDEFLEFENIETPLHHRPDICAFLLLDKLVPGKLDMVTAAWHDEICLDTDCTELADWAH